MCKMEREGGGGREAERGRRVGRGGHSVAAVWTNHSEDEGTGAGGGVVTRG